MMKKNCFVQKKLQDLLLFQNTYCCKYRAVRFHDNPQK